MYGVVQRCSALLWAILIIGPVRLLDVVSAYVLPCEFSLYFGVDQERRKLRDVFWTLDHKFTMRLLVIDSEALASNLLLK